MVFTSSIFLGIFLPALFSCYFFANIRARSYVLLIFSIAFYAWGEPKAIWVMLALMIFNYLFGLAIGKCHSRPWKLLCLWLGVSANLSALVCYKYLMFFAENLLPLLKFCGWQFTVPNVVLPIGISFYIFQMMSYLADVYRGEVLPQRNPFLFMLYVSFFPQLIAGPIVRYVTIAEDIANRSVVSENIWCGIQRFIFGLSKKVLIADSMALIADQIFGSKAASIPCAYCWLGAVAYSLQIYFDFSGYSDMAIGLGRMFNFRFLENFNYPYSATSIQDFWRRWHISLSTWFRDYLYIPLGGNRQGRVRTYINMFVVFFLCGLWHGASWNFVVWGVYHGMGLVIERLGFGRLIARLPRALANLYLWLFVMVGWVFFRAPDLSYAVSYLGTMFGFNESAGFTTFTRSFSFISLHNVEFLFAGLLFSYPFAPRLEKRIPFWCWQIVVAVLFVVVFVFALTSTYSPFIYFRF